MLERKDKGGLVGTQKWRCSGGLVEAGLCNTSITIDLISNAHDARAVVHARRHVGMRRSPRSVIVYGISCVSCSAERRRLESKLLR